MLPVSNWFGRNCLRRRVSIFVLLFPFYVVQLALFQTGINDAEVDFIDDDVESFITAINILVLITTAIALLTNWMYPATFERIVSVFNSLLFGLTLGWLQLIALSLETFTIPCFVFNVLVALSLVALDVLTFMYAGNKFSPLAMRSSSEQLQLFAAPSPYASSLASASGPIAVRRTSGESTAASGSSGSSSSSSGGGVGGAEEQAIAGTGSAAGIGAAASGVRILAAGARTKLGAGGNHVQYNKVEVDREASFGTDDQNALGDANSDTSGAGMLSDSGSAAGVEGEDESVGEEHAIMPRGRSSVGGKNIGVGKDTARDKDSVGGGGGDGADSVTASSSSALMSSRLAGDLATHRNCGAASSASGASGVGLRGRGIARTESNESDGKIRVARSDFLTLSLTGDVSDLQQQQLGKPDFAHAASTVSANANASGTTSSNYDDSSTKYGQNRDAVSLRSSLELGTRYRHIQLEERVFEGFRLNLSKVPSLYDEACPNDVDWNSLVDVQHRVDSSSCNIYTALWVPPIPISASNDEPFARKQGKSGQNWQTWDSYSDGSEIADSRGHRKGKQMEHGAYGMREGSGMSGGVSGGVHGVNSQDSDGDVEIDFVASRSESKGMGGSAGESTDAGLSKQFVEVSLESNMSLSTTGAHLQHINPRYASSAHVYHHYDRQSMQGGGRDLSGSNTTSSSASMSAAVAVPVIVKMIKQERLSSAVAVSEFETEEHVLRRMRHPNVIRLLGTGQQPRKFLVLELLSGGTIAHSLGLKFESVVTSPPHMPPRSNNNNYYNSSNYNSNSSNRSKDAANGVLSPQNRHRHGDPLAGAVIPGNSPQMNPLSPLSPWKRRFSLLEVYRIALSLARAVNHLHNEWNPGVHLIHRDLKPDNIGWSADGVLKLFDFGLCASVRAQRERTEQYRLTGNTGTLRYMAPEVVLGRSYHKSVDAYSFGVLIWQVATGRLPYGDMGKKAYFDNVVIGGQRLRMNKRWPPAFCSLLQRCWHEDKNARPDFRIIVRELEALILSAEEQQRQHMQRVMPRLSHWLWYGCLRRWGRPVLLLLCLAAIACSIWIVQSYAGLVAQDDSLHYSTNSSSGSGTSDTDNPEEERLAKKLIDLGAAITIVAGLGLYGVGMSYLRLWPYMQTAEEQIVRRSTSYTDNLHHLHHRALADGGHAGREGGDRERGRGRSRDPDRGEKAVELTTRGARQEGRRAYGAGTGAGKGATGAEIDLEADGPSVRNPLRTQR